MRDSRSFVIEAITLTVANGSAVQQSSRKTPAIEPVACAPGKLSATRPQL
jgi:hypothetical protein